MRSSDGLQSYTGIPLAARVMERRLPQPLTTLDRVERRLVYLRDEWRAAKTQAQRSAIEAEARELKRQTSAEDDHRAATDRTDVVPEHYDGCDGCRDCDG